MINNFIKILYFDKFIVFRDTLKMKTISHYLFKVIWIIISKRRLRHLNYLNRFIIIIQRP